MNVMRFIIAAVVVFGFIFGLEWYVHGQLLMGMYEETAHVWRPEGEALMHYMLASQMGFSFVLAYIFTRNYEGRGLPEGIRFGILFGLLIGFLELGTYAYLPISLTLVLYWVGTAIVKGVGAGILLALIYKD